MCGLSPTRPVRPSDLFSLASVGTLSLHPLGDHVVFSVVRPDEKNDRLQSDLFICTHQAGETPEPPDRLTSGTFDTKPRHSPDGKTVAFIRRIPGLPTKIIALEIATRQEFEMASFDNDAAEICWIDDDRLAVLAPTITEAGANRPQQSSGPGQQLQPKVITRLGYRVLGTGWVENSIGRVHILTREYDMWTKSILALHGEPASETTSIRSISIAPDRHAIATVTSGDQDDDDITGASNLWSIDIATGTGTLLHRGGRWERVLWHAKGHIVAIGNTEPRHFGFSRPYIFDPERADQPNSYRAIGSSEVNAWPVVQMDRGLVAVRSGVLCLGSRRGAHWNRGPELWGLFGGLGHHPVQPVCSGCCRRRCYQLGVVVGHLRHRSYSSRPFRRRPQYTRSFRPDERRFACHLRQPGFHPDSDPPLPRRLEMPG